MAPYLGRELFFPKFPKGMKIDNKNGSDKFTAGKSS